MSLCLSLCHPEPDKLPSITRTYIPQHQLDNLFQSAELQWHCCMYYCTMYSTLALQSSIWGKHYSYRVVAGEKYMATVYGICLEYNYNYKRWWLVRRSREEKIEQAAAVKPGLHKVGWWSPPPPSIVGQKKKRRRRKDDSVNHTLSVFVFTAGVRLLLLL